MEAPTPATTLLPVYQPRSSCRACDRIALEPILDLSVQYLPRFVEEPDLDLPKAPLVLVRCEVCGLLQLGHTVDPDLLYREFHYRSGINQTMRDGLRDLVADGVSYHSRGNWLDIGANDGFLLSCLPQGFARFACEPALNFADELKEIAHLVASEYFSAGLFKDKFDIITSAACFYDVDEPGQFVADVAALLQPRGVWINQLNDSPGMIRSHAFDSICHEHVCYFDVPTLARLYAQHGLEIVSVSFNDINGGSIRVSAQRKGIDPPADLAGLGTVSREEAHAFARRTRRWREHMLDVLGGLSRRGTIWGAGASTKGGVLLQYLNASHESALKGIGDRNERKHGKRMFGTWTPITSEEHMRAAEPAAVVVLPWAFKTEIEGRERELVEAGTPLIWPLPEITVTS